MEASTVHQQKNGHLEVNGASDKKSDSVKTYQKEPQETKVLLEDDGSGRNEIVFNMAPSNSPIDIKFEKITFTATEGSIIKGKR